MPKLSIAAGRSREHALQWLLLGAALALLAVALVVQFRIAFRQAWESDATSLGNQADLIAAAVLENLRAVDATFDMLEPALGPDSAGQPPLKRIAQQLEVAANTISGVRNVLLIDAKGRVLASNYQRLIGADLSDRPHFATMRGVSDRQKMQLMSSYREADGRLTMALGRRLLDADGSFAGYLLAEFEPDALHRLLTVSISHPDMVAMLVQQDGVIAFSSVKENRLAGTKLVTDPSSVLARFVAGGQDDTVFTEAGVNGDDDRLIALRKLVTPELRVGQPITLLLSREVGQITKNWWAWALGQILVYLLVALAGAFGLFFYQRRARANALQVVAQREEREASFALLAASEERFRSLLQHLPVAYFALDPQGLWVDANRQTLRMLRVNSLASLLDRPFVDIWETRFSALYGGSFARFHEQAGPVAEMTLLRDDGSPVTVVAVMHDEYRDGRQLWLVHGLLYDISEQLALQERLMYVGADFETKVQARTRALTQANDMLRDLARRDELTGLANRLAANELLQSEFAAVRRGGRPYAVLVFDIDHFKRVNDTHGHRVGDEVLRQVAQVLLGDLRRNDFLARFGGEEFLAVLVDTDLAAASLVADKLRAAVESMPHPVAGVITVSVGLGMARPEDADERAAVEVADRNLYAAKQSGRNQVVAEAA
jgi:diguanylate cyclase (GGDEF)-like protein/PAS domain S-box-containing protein